MGTDPTGGNGYAARAKLPSAHMTTIADGVGKAIDKTGTDTLSGTLTVTGDIIVGTGGHWRVRVAADAGTSSLTVDEDDDVTVFNGAIGVGYTVNLPVGSADQDGTIKRIINDAGGAMTLQELDGPILVATVPDGACVEIYYSHARTGWFVSGYSGSVTSPRF